MDRAVEEGLTEGLLKHTVVGPLALACEELGIVVRCRDEGKDLTRLGLNGDDGTTLSIDAGLQELGERMMRGKRGAIVDGKREVTPWDGSTVVRTAIQTSLDTATGIAVEDLLTLDTTQYLFVGALYSASADEVPAHDRAVTLEVGEAGFGEVAQEVGGIVVVVLADGTGAHREAWELIQLLLEASYFLGLKL